MVVTGGYNWIYVEIYLCLMGVITNKHHWGMLGIARLGKSRNIGSTDDVEMKPAEAPLGWRIGSES